MELSSILSGAKTTGHVSAVLRDEHGRVVRRLWAPNSFCHAYANNFAKLLAGAASPITLTLSHISLGDSGVTVETCEAVAGWTGTPVLDTSSFRQGAASFSRQVAASTSAQLISPAKSLDLSAATHVELWLKVDIRARLSAATECLRLQTSTGNYYAVNWDAIETTRGSALVDGQWTRVVVPVTAFTTTGAPSWSSITAVYFTVTANANGAVAAGWDGVTAIGPIDSSSTATAVPNEVSKLALASLEDLGSGQARAKAFWNSSQAVGAHRVLGLYGDAGATLAAIVELPAVLEKLSLLTLTVEWTVTTSGG